MAFWIEVNGESYDFAVVAERIPCLFYDELEEQTGIKLEEMVNIGDLSINKMVSAVAFLIRRKNGDQLTYRQAAQDVTPGDFKGFGEKPDVPDAPDPQVAPQDGAEAVASLSGA